jgi:hypothetical protein
MGLSRSEERPQEKHWNSHSNKNASINAFDGTADDILLTI